MTIATQLAQYALNAFENPIPQSVLRIATQAIIDQYGLQVGGSEFSWSKSVYSYTQKFAKNAGNSRITRYGDRQSAAQAAFINSCFAHAQDFDDSHQEAQTHPGSVVIPAAIAIGQEFNLSGSAVLKAIVIGMEIMLRLAHSLCPACIEGGHHNNCCYLIHPAIQAFLEICKTHNLSHEQIENVKVGMSQFSISHAGKIVIPLD